MFILSLQTEMLCDNLGNDFFNMYIYTHIYKYSHLCEYIWRSPNQHTIDGIIFSGYTMRQLNTTSENQSLQCHQKEVRTIYFQKHVK